MLPLFYGKTESHEVHDSLFLFIDILLGSTWDFSPLPTG